MSVRSILCRLNDPAGDFGPRVARGLGVKVVRAAMDDHRAPDHVLKAKPVGEHRQIGLAAAGQQRRQISGMIRVGQTGGIVMAERDREAIPGTTDSFVDVQGEKPAGIVPGQPGNMGGDQNALGHLAELDCARQGGRGGRAVKPVASGLLWLWIC